VGIISQVGCFYRNYDIKLLSLACFLLVTGYEIAEMACAYPFLAKIFRLSNRNILIKSRSFKYSDNLHKTKPKKNNFKII